jgi:selenocysteine-specific elongation factor
VTVVIGTAGHIDHGKTTLLRALTGIDADRLPEERRRGMTIDVGYAHLALADGTELDFVDVPGHDRLVGNMLVGAGEIDAALLVVAADDGLRAQTHEHLALLDGLALRHAVVAVTKTDLVEPVRVVEVVGAVADRLASTSLAGATIVPVSASTGDGTEALAAALVALRDAVLADLAHARTGSRPSRLAVDRVFRVKGRGVVVTGTLRGGGLERGTTLRVVPGDATVRVREVQVHGASVERVLGGGRTALNLAGQEAGRLARGSVLTADPGVVASDRLLVRLATPVPDRARFRLHLGTAAAEVAVGRSGRDAIALADGTAGAVIRLDETVAVSIGDRFVLRRAAGDPAVVGGIVLDPSPPRAISRRRQIDQRVEALADAVAAGDDAGIATARTELHGILPGEQRVAMDVREAARSAALENVAAHHAARPRDAGPTLEAVRGSVARSLRRTATIAKPEAIALATTIVADLVSEGALQRDGDRVRDPDRRPVDADPAVAVAMDRLEAALDTIAPPPLREAAAAAGCPPAAVRDLERHGRIVVLEDDLGYAMSIYRDLAAKALALAANAPLTPAAFRDSTGTSRRYVMPILEDLDRRGILRRTPAGHVPGPRAPAAARSADR